MRILAILTVRNEAAFLLEWLAHHRATGFTDFLVLSNDCDDGTDAMLDRLQALGQLTHVRNDGPHPEGPQWAALKAADRHPLREAADWVLFLDIDEFVNIHVGDRTVAALLAARPEATAFALTWRLFGNAGVRAYDDQPVTRSFVQAAPAVLWWPWRAALFKTLFRNDGTYGKLGVHRPRSPDRARLPHARWVDGSGRTLPPAFHTARIFSDFGQDNYQIAQLNHYALGAMESYLVKADRGRANREASAADIGYWVERNFCAVEDRSILAMADRSDAVRAGFLADPELQRLHHAAVAWRHDRYNLLMQQEGWRGLMGRLMLAPPSRVLTRDEAEVMLTPARAALAAGRATAAPSAPGPKRDRRDR